jgi:hypothetical protein
MPAQNPPDINSIVAAWSTFAAALVALGAILFELIKGASARRRHIRDRLEKQENIRNMIIFLMTPIKLVYYKMLFMEKEHQKIYKGKNEDKLLEGLHVLYSQVTILSPKEVEKINKLIHLLESFQAVTPLEIVTINHDDAKSCYETIKEVANAMGKLMSKFEGESDY